MAYDIISEIAFGSPFGFVETASDVGGLIKGFHDGMYVFGFMSRLYMFTAWIKKTWIGKRYLVARPEQKNGIGALMRFRDRVLQERLRDIENGATIGRVDMLQK